MGTWDGLFAAGMPGVVSATLTPQRGAETTAHVQWWRELGVAAEGGYQVATVACRMQGTEAALAHLRRGDRANVAGVAYQFVTDAETDDHGVCTAYLEPVR